MQSPIKWHVKTVKVVNYLSLAVTFNDGTEGVVSISPHWLTGVFSALENHDAFNAVSVQHGSVTWENGLDLDPKTMYDAIKMNDQYSIE
jgi:hypothetical protein